MTSTQSFLAVQLCSQVVCWQPPAGKAVLVQEGLSQLQMTASKEVKIA